MWTPNEDVPEQVFKKTQFQWSRQDIGDRYSTALKTTVTPRRISQYLSTEEARQLRSSCSRYEPPRLLVMFSCLCSRHVFPLELTDAVLPTKTVRDILQLSNKDVTAKLQWDLHLVSTHKEAREGPVLGEGQWLPPWANYACLVCTFW